MLHVPPPPEGWAEKLPDVSPADLTYVDISHGKGRVAFRQQLHTGLVAQHVVVPMAIFLQVAGAVLADMGSGRAAQAIAKANGLVGLPPLKTELPTQ